jgi:hypothetical protein
MVCRPRLIRCLLLVVATALLIRSITPANAIAARTAESVFRTNAASDSRYFIRQHYIDFLGRQPDESGWAFWENTIEQCGGDLQCREVKRISASAAFYLSIEFQETGFLLERLYKSAYGDAIGASTLGEPAGSSHSIAVPIILLNEFAVDSVKISDGVIVLQADWQQRLETNKVNFITEFIQRSRFTDPSAFPVSMTPAAFVDRLNSNIGVVLSSPERAAAVSEFGNAPDTNDVAARVRALRRVAENQTFARAGGQEFNRAFVLMQYFGYLRRNPSDSPESTRDYTGYEFWLKKLNNFNGNFVDAEMVKAFLSSAEYQSRFTAPPSIGAESWRADLKSLATQLPALHKNLFFQVSRAQFNQAVADLDRDIPTLSDAEIISRMMQIVALAGDAHTSLSAQGSAFPLAQYPLRMTWFSDGLYVTQTTAPYRRALGAKLIKIGNTDVATAYTLVSSNISHENDQWVKATSPALLSSPEILFALRILPDTLTGHYEFQDRAGNQLIVDLAPVSASEKLTWFESPDPAQVTAPSYRKNPTLNYWFEYLDAARTVYFQYNLCQNMPQLPFNQFFSQMQSFVVSHQTDRFVIDLRNNVGGDSAILQPLINALASDPGFNQSQRLFVIIGRSTISSGLLNAISLRQQTKATFVGEPTGGKPNHYGQVSSFRLSNSRLLIQYSTKFFQTTAGDPASLFPDLNAPISSTDYFSGRDPVLEAILSFH